MSRNTEGLMYLAWDDFDCPLEEGSAFKFMEREPVLILDQAIDMMKRKMFTEIVMAYTSPAYANKKGLSKNDSHRVGKAVLLKVPDAKKKHDLLTALLALGARRIALQGNRNRDHVYYDCDEQKERGIFTWNMRF